MAKWLDLLHGPLDAAVQLALPPRCAGCGVPVGEDHRVCAGCWSSLRFLAPPWCARCNLPFAYDRGDDARCVACLAEPPRHAGVRAAVAYGDVARGLALRLKYGGRTAFAETMARQMARVMPEDADLLVPVPLHRWRIWSRGFNQAALIADAVARRTGIACEHTALTRVKRTPLLRGLGAKGRARAVAGAFRVADRSRIAGRAVVLVDDVYTSGATAAACTRALLANGARSVTILCWARVLDTAPAIDKPAVRSHFGLMAKVEIYTKAFCPYCSRAMKLLASKGVEPEEYDISLGGPKRAEMLARSGGRSTVPQVFIDGRHIGGSDDLAALERQGTLDPLLGG